MPTLTIYCRYPDDDEITSVPFGFATLEEAEAARAAVLERVRAGGLFYLGDEERPRGSDSDPRGDGLGRHDRR